MSSTTERRDSRTIAELTSRRINRIRFEVALLFGLVFALGFGLFAAVLLANDARDIDQSARNQLEVSAIFWAFRVDYDESTNQITKENYVPQAAGSTYVVASPPAGSPGSVDDTYLAPLPDPWPDVNLGPLTARAVENGEETFGTVDYNGTQLRAVAVPIVKHSDGKSSGAGAIVAVTDVTSADAAHRRLVIETILGGLALILVSAGLGYLISGRTTRLATDALRQQERFLADAAHELRTPIASIRAVAETALAPASDEETVALERIVRITETSSVLVDDLLTLARMDAHQQEVDKEPVRLDLLTEEICGNYDDIAFDGEDVVVHADATLARRAVDNLVRNAVKHARAGNERAAIRVTVRSAGKGGVVTVADEGPGIEPSLLPDLFDRFQSGRSSSGSGLGLAIVDWIAWAHDGSVTARNRERGGAEFTFTFG